MYVHGKISQTFGEGYNEPPNSTSALQAISQGESSTVVLTKLQLSSEP